MFPGQRSLQGRLSAFPSPPHPAPPDSGYDRPAKSTLHINLSQKEIRRFLEKYALECL